MPKRIESANRFPLLCVLFSLMVAVFAFGLHARILLVRSGISTTPSKISMQRRSSTEVVAETVDNDPPTPHQTQQQRLAVPLYLLPRHEVLRSFQVESSLWRSSRLDSHGPSLMLRPPPVQL